MAEDDANSTAVADTLAASNDETRDASTSPRDLAVEPAQLTVIDAAAYELGHEIARGGMGRIVRAVDRRHGRPVAIKMLLRGGDDAIARFVREATIASRLQHPAIVPVYEAGRWPTGEPFFAMKLVEGRSLDRAIAEATDLRTRLELLPKLISVTEALGYAHGRRVIHRDLKPHNVLCGDFGETVVIDWGLAKHIDSEDVSPQVSGGHGDEALTVAGSAMGTPRYMPPEQARGAAADERSDVYALGAMLYHLVSGAAPYEDADSSTAIERVLEGPPPPLAEREIHAPPDLCTIVAKAMAREPSERYASAAELAAELRRFASGQLVSAHDYSIAALVRRFVARHRTTMLVAAALVAILIVISIVGVQRIMRERDRADSERAVAVTQRNAALAERAAAEELVDFIQNDLRERLAPVGRTELLDGVATRVEAYYRATGSNDAAARARRAAALGLDGHVATITDDVARAERSYMAALALRQEVVRERPDDPEALRQLALAHLAVANTRKARNDARGALADNAAGLRAARRAVERAPAHTNARLALIEALTTGAIALGPVGRLDDAAAQLAEALTEARAVAAAHPEHRDVLARVLELSGAGAQQRGRYEDARAALDEAIAIWREIVARSPGDTREQASLARALRVRAGVSIDLGEREATLAAYREERTILERLLVIEPGQTRWQAFLAENHLDVGDRLRLGNDFAGAEREYMASRVIAKRRAEQLPDDTLAQFALANVESALGDLLSQRGDGGALAHLETAQAIFDGLVERAPQVARWRYAAARGRGAMAAALANAGDLAAARREIERALDGLDELVKREPSAVVYLQLRAELTLMHTAIVTAARAPRQEREAAARRSLAALEAVRAANALTPELESALDDLNRTIGAIH